MATTYSYTRPGILNALAAQRDEAVMAARPEASQRDVAQVLAKDLMEAIKANNTTEARRIALELKPFLGLLP